MNKREMVETYLNGLCQELDLMEMAHDPYPVPEDEQDAVLGKARGLISYTKYEPGTPEWEGFAPEGWLWTTPSDAQVEEIYPDAQRYSED